MTSTVSDGCGNSYIVGDYIGKGSFSQVYILECCITKKHYAGKFISKEKLNKYGLKDKVWEEIKIHQKLRHKNIVQFYNFIIKESHVIIVLEYCSKFSLVNILSSIKKLNVCEAKFFMEQILSAVEYLHSNHIVHRDLKLGNLFINQLLEVKLGDFGLAITIEYKGQKRFSRCGTPNYISPEVINGVGHSYEVDVWALGCILYTMLEGTPPFQGVDTTSTYNNILKGNCRFSPLMNQYAKTFIVYCLQSDPKVRPTVSELLKFDFISSTEIKPIAPYFDFSKNNRKSSMTKRGHLYGKRPSSIISYCLDEFCISRFQALYTCLKFAHVWTESKFGEFLSESSSKLPVVWINSWMDYTNSYGFAYQLSTLNYGIIFNDGTRMFCKQEEEKIHYTQSNGSFIVFKIDMVPDSLKKKLKVLVFCRKYMNETLREAHEPNPSAKYNRDAKLIEEVFHWTRGDNETAMFMANGSVQINFTSDHIKMILCGTTKTVTVIEPVDCLKTLKLSAMSKCGCSKDLKRKLLVGLEHIKKFLKERTGDECE